MESNKAHFITSSKKSIFLWDSGSFEICKSIRPKIKSDILDCSLSSNGRYIAASGWKGKISIYDVALDSHKTVDFAEYIEKIEESDFAKGKIRCIEVSGSGCVAALAGNPGKLIIYRDSDGEMFLLSFDFDVVRVVFIGFYEVLLVTSGLDVVKINILDGSVISRSKITFDKIEYAGLCLCIDAKDGIVSIAFRGSSGSKSCEFVALLREKDLKILNVFESPSGKVKVLTSEKLFLYGGEKVRVLNVDTLESVAERELSLIPAYTSCSYIDWINAICLSNSSGRNLILNDDLEEICKIDFPTSADAAYISRNDEFLAVSSIMGKRYVFRVRTGGLAKEVSVPYSADYHVTQKCIFISEDGERVSTRSPSPSGIATHDIYKSETSIVPFGMHFEGVYIPDNEGFLVVQSGGSLYQLDVNGAVMKVFSGLVGRALFSDPYIYVALSGASRDVAIVACLSSNGFGVEWSSEVSGKVLLLSCLKEKNEICCVIPGAAIYLDCRDGKLVARNDIGDVNVSEKSRIDRNGDVLFTPAMDKDEYYAYDLAGSSPKITVNGLRGGKDRIVAILPLSGSSEIVTVSEHAAIILWRYKNTKSGVKISKKLVFDWWY